ncbi:UNVERIFIED_CONTAM: CRS2-associated factor 2, mitochondrial [Sesamum calycinum]|uniref:CRS2-associated factor 2, mitochondrial n=1 Tax=Sesamum calycinum TaxID=2727403 RepID=A0AAW2Q4V9_9LAMI
MLKLFSWRRSVHHPQPLNPRLFPRLLSSPLPFLFISRFLGYSPPAEDEEMYDPPFSPTPTHTAKWKNKSKIIKKKNQAQKVANKINSDGANGCPVKSELPFDFMYSYSETSPGVEPIGFREPKRFSPFGPSRIDRKWTGTRAPAEQKPDLEKLAEERERVLGEPLSEEEVAELVEKYRHSNCSRQINLALHFAARNGVYVNVVERVRTAFETEEVVRLDCTHVGTSDCKKIGAKLRDLVPCIPLLFKDEQIILWKGYKERE